MIEKKILKIGRLQLLSRAEWCAEPPKEPYETHIPRGIIFHHSAIPGASDYHGWRTVKEIQRLHQQDRGFSDIGYHFLIGPDGIVFEGRPARVLGAHTKSANQGNLGICFIGDYRKQREVLTLSTLRAGLTLCYFLFQWFEIHPSSYRWHRQHNPDTECPGEQVMEWIPRFQEILLSLIGNDTEKELLK